MNQKIAVPLEEIKRVYELLEKVNSFFHQPENFEDPEATHAWAKEHYHSVHHSYKNIVWNWLPHEVQKHYALRK